MTWPVCIWDLFPNFNFYWFDIYELVLGLPHPAVNTRDVALYLPFRNSLNSGNHVPGLQTLAQRFLGRNCQQGHIEPVSIISPASEIPNSWFYLTTRPRTLAFVWTSIARILNGKPQLAAVTGPVLSHRALSRAAISDVGMSLFLWFCHAMHLLACNFWWPRVCFLHARHWDTERDYPRSVLISDNSN
jgi:hypothetical protein